MEKEIYYLFKSIIYLYAKDPHGAKYQFLINKREKTGLKHFNDFKAIIEYLSDMDNI